MSASVTRFAYGQEEAEKQTGDGEGIFLSYTLGFKNGLAAITHHEILRKN